jgi:hypothetical protein
MKDPRPEDENSIQKSENKPKPKKRQCSSQVDHRQISIIYLLADIQVVFWLVLSLVACAVSYSIDLWMIVALIERIVGTTMPVNFEPVSVMIPISTNAVTILFLIQLRAANKRLDTIWDRLLGAG